MQHAVNVWSSLSPVGEFLGSSRPGGGCTAVLGALGVPLPYTAEESYCVSTVTAVWLSGPSLHEPCLLCASARRAAAPSIAIDLLCSVLFVVSASSKRFAHDGANPAGHRLHKIGAQSWSLKILLFSTCHCVHSRLKLSMPHQLSLAPRFTRSCPQTHHEHCGGSQLAAACCSSWAGSPAFLPSILLR